MMTEESAKATQEIAKTARKGIDALEKFGQWLAPIIGEPVADAVGILLGDRLKYYRWKQQILLMTRANEFLAQRGIVAPTRTIPLKFALPLLEGATLEDDENMRDRWAKLLVNWADTESGVEQRRVFIQILESIGPLEARILEVIYANPFDRMPNGVRADQLPDAAPPVDDKPMQARGPSKEILLALANLARLYCLTPATTWGGAEVYSIVVPTELGRAFVEAVTLRSGS